MSVRVAGIMLVLGLATQLVPTWGLRTGPILLNRSGGIQYTVGGPDDPHLRVPGAGCVEPGCQNGDPAR